MVGADVSFVLLMLTGIGSFLASDVSFAVRVMGLTMGGSDEPMFFISETKQKLL